MSNLACFATGSRNLAISICRSGRFEVKKAKRPRCLSPAGPPPPSRLHRTGQRRQLVDALNATLAVETDASVTTITHMVHTGQDLRRRIMIGSLIAFVWTSFAATFVLVMKLIRLGSHTGFAPLCGPVLLFAILGAMLGLVTLSPVDARSIRLAFGVCTAYAYIWGMLFFMIGLATAASCETAHELKCANWAFWWFAIAVIDWALASWLIWKRMREPSTGQQRNTRLIGMMWRALRTSACPPARPVSSSASSAMPCMTRTWMGGASEEASSSTLRRRTAHAERVLGLLAGAECDGALVGALTRRDAATPSEGEGMPAEACLRPGAPRCRVRCRDDRSLQQYRQRGGAYRLAVSAMVEQAKQNFYAIPTSSLHLVDLASNEDTGLNERVGRAKLGQVDAFVSHSWHDSGEPKFAALMDWANGFESRRGRAPRVWLDKACIQQTAIEESLRMLPIFLPGCRTLLILAGRTYTSRLWCVLECFVFLKMGGEPERIQVYPFSEESDKSVQEVANSAVVVHRLERFDARRATCFKEDERQHLLSVIRAGFGSLDEFNSTMRGLFIDKMQPHLAGLQRQASGVGARAHVILPRQLVRATGAQGHGHDRRPAAGLATPPRPHVRATRAGQGQVHHRRPAAAPRWSRHRRRICSAC